MDHHRELLSTLLYNCKLLTQDHTDLLTMMMTMILLWSQRGYLVFDVGYWDAAITNPLWGNGCNNLHCYHLYPPTTLLETENIWTNLVSPPQARCWTFTILAFADLGTAAPVSVSWTRLLTPGTSPASRTRARACDWITRGSIVTGTRVSTVWTPSPWELINV